MDFMGVPPASDALDADATPRQGSTQHQQHQIRPFRLKKQPESSSFDGFDGGPPASDALDVLWMPMLPRVRDQNHQFHQFRQSVLRDRKSSSRPR